MDGESSASASVVGSVMGDEDNSEALMMEEDLFDELVIVDRQNLQEAFEIIEASLLRQREGSISTPNLVNRISEAEAKVLQQASASRRLEETIEEVVNGAGGESGSEVKVEDLRSPRGSEVNVGPLRSPKRVDSEMVAKLQQEATRRLEKTIEEVVRGSWKGNGDFVAVESVSNTMDSDYFSVIPSSASHNYAYTTESGLEIEDEYEILNWRFRDGSVPDRDSFDLSADWMEEGTPARANSGVCSESLSALQIFDMLSPDMDKPAQGNGDIGSHTLVEDRSNVDENLENLQKVKAVYNLATHRKYIQRHLTEEDWNFFCYHLFTSDLAKSINYRKLQAFVTSREKLSHIFCATCQELIPNGDGTGYETHMRLAHQQSPVIYPCDICGKGFPEKDMTATTEDYYPHWISHFYFYQCDICGKPFPSRRALDNHIKLHEDRSFKCDECGKVVRNKKSLYLHLLKHLSEKEMSKYMKDCRICGKKMPEQNLKCHMLTHTEERPWKCDQCNLTYKTKSTLVKHRGDVHFKLKKYLCNLCGDGFTTAVNLRGHIRRHEGRKDFQCEVCRQEFYTHRAIMSHKVNVHQTVMDFLCSTCGKTFKTNNSLEDHLTIHTGEMRFGCQICGKKLRLRSCLYKHLKTHKKSGTTGAIGTTPTISESSAATTTSKNEAGAGAMQVESGEICSSTMRTATGEATNYENATLTLTCSDGVVYTTPILCKIVPTVEEEVLNYPPRIHQAAQPKIICNAKRNAVEVKVVQLD